MTPAERRNRISAIFEVAIKLGPEEQTRFLERECLGQATLLEEIRSLLARYEESVIRPIDSGARSEPRENRDVPRHIGRYEIKEEIGRGGFGQVYSALDSRVGRVVAIKVLNAPEDPDLMKRFHAEATTVANLHHKNIVTVHDFGEDNGVPYIVMEFLEGTNVRDLIRQRTPLALDEKLGILSEVAEGLDYAHQHGVIHRDVKPANIMRLADGSVKIMDFGIARLAREGSARLTHTGLVVGTLTYMAPEQLSGVASSSSDIFAFGLTSYEFLTGQHPFSSDDPAVVMYRIVNSDPEPVRSFLPECPETIERIVSRTVAKSRHLRYSSLADVVSDLRPVLLDLRRQHAGELFTKSEWLLGTEQIEAAQSAVRRALELDPWHPQARELRSRIEQALYHRDLMGRAGALLDRAEQELGRRHFTQAAECLATVRQVPLSDPRVRDRLARADKQLEDAKSAERLLQAARDHSRKEDCTEALELASAALALDPANPAGQQFLDEIIEQRNQRRQPIIQPETPQPAPATASNPAAEPVFWREAEERIQRLNASLEAVRSLMDQRRFDEAAAEIVELTREFPESIEFQALKTRAAEEIAQKHRQAQQQQTPIHRTRSGGTLLLWVRSRVFVGGAIAAAAIAFCGIVVWQIAHPKPTAPIQTVSSAPETRPQPTSRPTPPPRPTQAATPKDNPVLTAEKATKKPPEPAPASQIAEPKGEKNGSAPTKFIAVSKPSLPAPLPPPRIQDISPAPIIAAGPRDYLVSGAGFRDGLTAEVRPPGAFPSPVPVLELKETSFHLDLTVDRPGDYELVVHSGADESHYPFHVAAPPQPPTPSPPPKPTPQNFLSNNCPVLSPGGQLATFDPGSDCELRQILAGNSSRALVHKYAFHVNSHQHLTVTVDASRGTERFTPWLLLYAASSNRLAEGTSVGMAGAQISIDLNSGDYIILVTSRGRTAGQYVLGLKQGE